MQNSSPLTPTDRTPSKSLVASLADSEFHLLNWSTRDIEQRFGFRGGRQLGTGSLFTFCLGVLLSALLYSAVYAVMNFKVPHSEWITNIFLRPNNLPTVVPAVVLFMWGCSILLVKGAKLRLQARTLGLAAVPQEPDFMLTTDTARAVLERIHSLVDNPRHFILLNRIERALSNLKNIGQVGDVSMILRTQAENDTDQMASSYGLVNGFVWAIPVLGFIGTVLGLSLAIGKFSGVLESTTDLTRLKTSLGEVTGGLSTAFETTFIALVFALILQLWASFRQSRELEFLDECSDYCQTYVVSRLRLTSGNEDASLEEPAGDASDV